MHRKLRNTLPPSAESLENFEQKLGSEVEVEEWKGFASSCKIFLDSLTRKVTSVKTCPPFPLYIQYNH